MSQVVIKDCKSYELNELTAQLNEGIKAIGGWDKFVRPGMKVLLKVNLIGPKSSDSAAVTHCEFVRALTRILREKGCTVWIGDSAGGAIAGISPTVKSFEVSGLKRIAEEEGAVIKNFDREGVQPVTPGGDENRKMFLAKPMFEADLIINLPKFKTHMAGIYTGAVKNLFGCIPGLKKAEYHKMAPNTHEFGKVIADINESVKVGLHIMDGVIAMQGQGPTAGTVYHAQKILISEDPLALDTVATKMLGLSIEKIPIFDAARERNLGCWDLKQIQIIGDYSTPPALHGYQIPKVMNPSGRSSNILGKIVDFLKKRPRINMKTCKKCNVCVESCPVCAIDTGTKKIDYAKCIECLCCHELCMHQAVELKNDHALAGFVMTIFGGGWR